MSPSAALSKFSPVPVLKSLFRKSKKITLISHPNPDGDAVGSSLGLFHILKENHFHCSVILPNPFPGFLKFLPGSSRILFADENIKRAEKTITNSDLIILLDFNSLNRLENLKEIFLRKKAPVLLIDHHLQPDLQPDYWFWNVQASSTCELVYQLVKKIFPRYHFSVRAATCLYTGTMTDTGSFRFPSVRPSTHAMIQELMKSGMVHYKIHEAVYDQFRPERFQLMARALNKIQIFHEGKVACIYLSMQDLQECNQIKGDTEGFVNIPLSIRGVCLSAFFLQTEHYIKISLRSKGKVDVNRLARKYFQGGGHLNAAGGKWFGSVKELFHLMEKEIVL